MVLPSGIPELAALDLLRSVIGLGSVSRAAQAHGITQPSASSRIRTLERQLGITVLERSSTGSRPTADGRLVAGWADGILREAEALAAGVTALRADRRGLLRIMSSFTIAEHLLPPLLTDFLSTRPDDAVELDVANSEAVIAHVADGSVDLGFVESPTIPESMQHRVVGTDELVPVVSPRHEWAGRATVDLATFTATPLVLRERGSGTRGALESALIRLGQPAPRSVLDLGSISAIRVAVANGSSPSVVSRLAVADDLDRGRLVEVRVEDLRIVRELRAIWPAQAALPRLADAFLASFPAASPS